MKIEGNPNLTFQLVRRKLARWVNTVRTSDARLSNARGMSIGTEIMFHPGDHELGPFTIAYGSSLGGLHEFEYYNAFCGIAIELRIGHTNLWRDKSNPESRVQMVQVVITAARPLPKKDPEHIQPIYTGSELCDLTYLIGPTGVERWLFINGLRIDGDGLDSKSIKPVGVSMAACVFLDFVREVVEGTTPFQKYLPTRPPQENAWIHRAIVRKSGWMGYEQVVNFG